MYIKIWLAWLLCIIGSSCIAQEKNYSLSVPLDIKPEGWNKVLCMRNGNTLLFHFEMGKRVLVKVFDSTHREIATAQDKANVLDVFMIEHAVFKGLYDINGEAVLFIDQDRNSKHELVMLRYNGSDGKLIEDKLIGQSESENRRIRYYVVQNKDDDNYEILFCMDKRHPKETDMFLVYFNNKHQSLREVQLGVDRKKFDYLQVLGAESQPAGVLITVGMDSTATWGLYNERELTLDANSSSYEHYVQYYFIPKGDSVPRTKLVNLGTTFYPLYTLYTINPFAGALNSLMYSYRPLLYRFGLDALIGSFNAQIFFKIDGGDMSATYKIVKRANSNMYLKDPLDTVRSLNEVPIKMFTNDNGLSTIVTQTLAAVGERETSQRYDHGDYFGNIGVRQIGDDGERIWDTVLPLTQYFRSYSHYYPIGWLSHRWQGQAIFGDLQPEIFGRQFVSVNTFYKSRNCYIIFNDYDQNFSSAMTGKPVDTVYNLTATNACYYKIDRKKDVSRHYLFGAPEKKEYTSALIEGAGYDEQRGIYAALVQRSRDGKPSLHMAWARLE